MSYLYSRKISRFAFPLIFILITGCSDSAGQADQNGPPPSVEVGYVIAEKSSVPVETELPGRTSAYAISEVRPQVSGVIRSRAFTEGSMVREGQTLFQIDASLYTAAANEARAGVANAVAAREAAKARADRYRPLAEIEAISKQDYTDAVAAERQSAAQIALNQAQLQTAQTNLRFTRVPAPISGRIGRSYFTKGALVTGAQTQPLAIIQQLDPIYVDMQQSSAELLALRRAIAAQGTAPASVSVSLKLEDGRDYGPQGTVQFTEALVDPATGAVTLRARFPNPDGLLLPGMFVRAQFVNQIDTNVILVPQQALTRDPQGDATVYVVGQDNKAELRTVTATKAKGKYWIVTDGLQPGDKIITQGTGKIRPGQKIKPVPQSAPQPVVQNKSKSGTGRTIPSSANSVAGQ